MSSNSVSRKHTRARLARVALKGENSRRTLISGSCEPSNPYAFSTASTTFSSNLSYVPSVSRKRTICVELIPSRSELVNLLARSEGESEREEFQEDARA